jgi:hypothetical protein
MKKVLLIALALFAIAACEESGKKTADKMNTTGQEANDLADEGAKEYVKALYSGNVSTMSLEQLATTRSLYESSYTKLVSARDKYKKVLDLESANKESVTLIGKESINKNITEIDGLLASISTEVKKIDLRKQQILTEAYELEKAQKAKEQEQAEKQTAS